MDWNTFCEKVKSGAGKVAQQIGDTADIATMQVKLSLAEKKLEDAYTVLGKASYRHFMGKQNSADAVAEALELVKEAGREVASWKRKIKKKKTKPAKETPEEPPAEEAPVEDAPAADEETPAE